jgi:hypothetical protein
MQPLRRNINPFALMLDPQAVIAQIERSERLEALHRRVCRPLDKPLLGAAAEAGDETAEGPEAVDDVLAAESNGVDAPPDSAGDALIDGVPAGPLRHD